MAIQILDEERLEDTNEEYTSLEDTSEAMEAEESNPEPEDDIPEKYKGKTPAQIAKMHQEAEKLLGRQSSEVGELRKIVDDFVKAQLETKTAPAQSNDDEEEVDWYLDPQKAVEKAISNHPKMKEAEAINTEMRKQRILQELNSTHPDYMDIIQDSGFQEWVMGSKIRQNLLKQADQQYDIDAANELLGTWKERKQAVQGITSKEAAERKKQVKTASTGNITGSGEAPTRKIYRRADIIKLMQTDPDRYMQMADEIQQAYAENRVRS